MKKKFKCLLVLLSCYGFCTAQQVVSSGGYTEEAEGSVDWIIGGSLMDISGFDLSYFASGQMTQLAEEAFYLNVYPNPASDLLNVEITPSDTGQMFLEVFDLNGKTLINKTTLNEPMLQLDIKDLAEGAYFMKITQLNNEQQFRIEKIIKVKN